MKLSTFNIIRKIVYDRSGISLGDHKQAMVKSRIARRLRQLNISSYESYVRYLLNDGSGYELSQMLDAISTNTTHFYREEAHFALLRSVVRQWIKAGQRKIRIWCTASSTGEEPYTLAIEVLEATAHNVGIDIKILATDMAGSVLKTAMNGIYTDEKMQMVPTVYKDKYFKQINENENIYFAAKPSLKKILLFRQWNLSSLPSPLKHGLDIIFCRNVMIYFDKPLRGRLISEFKRLIRPGGYLFVGHSESFSAATEGFKPVRPSVYLRV